MYPDITPPLLHAPSNLTFERPPHAPITDWTKVPDGAHVVQFYDNEASLLELITGFVGTSLVVGGSAVIIATKAHREGVARCLRARGFNPVTARRQGRYLPLDAAATLNKILHDGWPDAERFEQIVGGALARAESATSERHPCVSAFGEMVGLCAEARPDVALRLEQLWNDLAERHLFSLCCGYPIRVFAGDQESTPFLKICAQHSHVLSAK